jgi:1-deoxy-D-xylulose-5-phosphate reductoisomerase
VIHSMVEFVDGSTIAQCSPPDMHLPIALGLGWPDRVPGAARAVDWTRAGSWTFEPLDEEAFPAVRLAKTAGRAGGCRPAIYNAANEELVEGFVAGRVAFIAIVDTLARVLDEAPDLPGPGTVDDVLAAQAWARTRARELIAASGSVTTG